MCVLPFGTAVASRELSRLTKSSALGTVMSSDSVYYPGLSEA